MVPKKEILALLEQVEDPELGINIVDLGLVYSVWVESDELVHVKITLTSPGCPAASDIMEKIQDVLEKRGFKTVDVFLVWDPPWTPDKMSERAKLALGIL